MFKLETKEEKLGFVVGFIGTCALVGVASGFIQMHQEKKAQKEIQLRADRHLAALKKIREDLSANSNMFDQEFHDRIDAIFQPLRDDPNIDF